MKDKFAHVKLDEVLYFQHIPKTAGTTLTYFLDRQFAKDEIFPYKTDVKWWKSEHFKEAVAQNKRCGAQGYRFVRGHFGYCFHHEIPGQPIRITMLRNAVNRCVSVYGHFQNVYKKKAEKGRPYAHSLYNSGESLEVFLNGPNSEKAFNNKMVHMLAVDADRRAIGREQLGAALVNCVPGDVDLSAYKNQSLDILYQLAKKHLDGFAFVGVQQYFQESMLMLAAMFHWRPLKTQKRFMVHRNRIHAKDVSPASIDALTALNQYDQQLVDHAEKRFKKTFLDLIHCKLGVMLSWEAFLDDRAKFNQALYRRILSDHRMHLISRAPHRALKAIWNERKHRTRVRNEYAKRKRLAGL